MISYKAVADEVHLTRREGDATESWKLTAEEAELLLRPELRDVIVTAKNAGHEKRRQEIERLKQKIKDLELLNQPTPDPNAATVRRGSW